MFVFAVENKEGEQPVRLYPISNSEITSFFGDLENDFDMNEPYDTDGKNLDNILITVTIWWLLQLRIEIAKLLNLKNFILIVLNLLKWQWKRAIFFLIKNISIDRTPWMYYCIKQIIQ